MSIREVFGKELEICNRCSHYRGYRFAKVGEYLNEKGETRCKYELAILCEIETCTPDVKPLSCGYCHIADLYKAIEEADIDQELKERLKQLDMCPNCYEDWTGECLCLLCYFDYPSSSIPGKKGDYCFCAGCEWNDDCPEKRKSFPDCEEMKEIPKGKVERITELI